MVIATPARPERKQARCRSRTWWFWTTCSSSCRRDCHHPQLSPEILRLKMSMSSCALWIQRLVWMSCVQERRLWCWMVQV